MTDDPIVAFIGTLVSAGALLMSAFFDLLGGWAATRRRRIP